MLSLKFTACVCVWSGAAHVAGFRWSGALAWKKCAEIKSGHYKANLVSKKERSEGLWEHSFVSAGVSSSEDREGCYLKERLQRHFLTAIWSDGHCSSGRKLAGGEKEKMVASVVGIRWLSGTGGGGGRGGGWWCVSGSETDISDVGKMSHVYTLSHLCFEQTHEDTTDSSGMKQQLQQLSVSVSQLGSQLSALEENLDQRLQRLSDTVTQEEHFLGSLTNRLSVVSLLADRMDELEQRFVKENSIIKSTIRGTSLDVQSLVTQLERFDGADGTSMGNSSDSKIRYAGSTHPPPPADEALTDLRQEERASSPRHRQHHQQRYQRRLQHQQQQQQHQAENSVCIIPENVVVDVTERLEKILARALEVHWSSVISDVRTMMVGVMKTSTAEINSQHAALTQLLIQQTGSLQLNLTKQLQQEHSTHTGSSSGFKVENKKYTVPGYKSLRPEAVTRKGTSVSKSTDEQPYAHQASHSMSAQWAADDRPLQPPCSPDVSTVAALSEVKVLLRSVLSASEDLRRSISRQTTEGLDLLQLLHQRFSVMLRRISSEPGSGQSLASEFQELENLVENSYSSILHAQNVFIASCHRIQDEEPLVEAKITDILDKIVTSIELGHQYNREQLGELRQLVRQMGSFNTTLEIPVVSTLTSDQSALLSSTRESTLRDAWTDVVRGINSTSERLGVVAARVAQVQNRLLSTNLEPLSDRKDLADQLLTSAKDLYGYARHQLQILTDLRLTVQRTLSIRTHSDNSHTLLLTDSIANDRKEIVLPVECTEALRPLLHNQDNNAGNNIKSPKTTEDDSLPVWYTDPDIVSGNFGTPQRRFPNFRDDWTDNYDDYHQDYREDVYDMETNEVKNLTETSFKFEETLNSSESLALGEPKHLTEKVVNEMPLTLENITHEILENLTTSETTF
ncbi:hypothetical protein FHG87_007089 [Trinorchestia longiramus]|nr:hypothetical protein FHG87_007089 [Trinorchestia longiramus]